MVVIYYIQETSKAIIKLNFLLLQLQEDLENYDAWKSNKSKPQLKTTVPKFVKSLQLEITSVYVKEPGAPKSDPQANKKPKVVPTNNNSQEIDKQMMGSLEPEIILNENWAKEIEKRSNMDQTTSQMIENANVIIIQQETIENIDINAENSLLNQGVLVCNERNKIIKVPQQSTIILPLEEDNYNIDISVEDESGKDLTGRTFLLTNVEINPIFYLGVPEHAYWIIEHISRNQLHIQLSVIITLFKIKTDDAFIRLSDEFQVSYDTLRQMYSKTVNVLASYFMPLICWPLEPVKNPAPPIRFLNENKEFVNIQCILDCFEIEIDKPLDPKRVIPIWSTERNCPTMKYLIAATPDGMIGFVSKGYRGGMSDAHMLTTSGFLDVVPKNCTVITNRSFKGLGKALNDRAVTLICLPPENHQYPPPPVSKGIQSLANLRAPVERIIRKIKEFKHLAPHSVVNEYFSGFLDKAVVIACGLINLQSFQVSESFKKSKMGTHKQIM